MADKEHPTETGVTNNQAVEYWNARAAAQPASPARERILEAIADLQGEHEVMAGPFDPTKWKIDISVADLQAILAAQPPAAPVETDEDDETIARRLATIFHGDDVEWKGFVSKAHHWMSLSIDAAGKRDQAHVCSSAESDLLPCPFCGGEPSWTGDYETRLGNISCENSDCFGPKTTAARYDDAVVQWNTRAQPQPLPKWRHLKRGSIVTEVARGFAQVAHHPIEEMTVVVIYKHDADGVYWVRNAVEFDDGRFEPYALSRPEGK